MVDRALSVALAPFKERSAGFLKGFDGLRFETRFHLGIEVYSARPHERPRAARDSMHHRGGGSDARAGPAFFIQMPVVERLRKWFHVDAL